MAKKKSVRKKAVKKSSRKKASRKISKKKDFDIGEEIKEEVQEIEKWVIARRKFLIKLAWVLGLIAALLIILTFI